MSNEFFFWDFPSEQTKPKHNVHIIGNGWAGYHFSKSLDKSKYNPVIISPSKHVVNTTKLIDTIISPDTKDTFENTHGTIITSLATDIEFGDKTIICEDGSRVKYEHLVLAFGSEFNDMGIKGVREHTFQLKTQADVKKIREHLVFGQISNLVVIGSGITGVEIASKLSKIVPNITVLEGAPSIMPGWNEQTKKVIHEQLGNTGIKILTNQLVDSINSNSINVRTNGIVSQMVYNPLNTMVIWSGGVRFSGYAHSKLSTSIENYFNIKIKPRGIETNDDFTIRTDKKFDDYPNVYCIGDIVSNHGPSSAQNARLQGEYLAKYFNSGFDKNFITNNKFKSIIKTQLVHLIDKIYVQSIYYQGWIPKFTEKIIDVFYK